MVQQARISWHGARAKSAARTGAARGLGLAAEHVLQVSNTRVPIEEGTLERSGVTDVDESELRASVSYDTPYAVVQHEDMTLQHDAGRSPKFLEQALDEEWKTAERIIAREVRKELGT
jgi:hypothetical protein